MTSEDIKLSKSLSWLLRHGVVSQGLSLEPGGYLPATTILNLKQFKNYTLDDLLRVIEKNDKQRFSKRINNCGIVEIRANQGHSIKVNDEELLTPILNAIDCPNNVIHGTYVRNWVAIEKEGLNRMKRNHIHFSSGLPKDGCVISGMRSDCDIYIYLNVEKALIDGIRLYKSENGVILSPGDVNGYIKPQYFLKIVKCL